MRRKNNSETLVKSTADFEFQMEIIIVSLHVDFQLHNKIIAARLVYFQFFTRSEREVYFC